MLNKLSLVIPCYNEEGNIPNIYKRISEVVGQRKDVEILLVNNGSKDASKSIFDKTQKTGEYPYIRVVDVTENKGYGFGILSGLKEATGNVLSWTHADLQTDVNDVLIAFDEYRKHSNKEIFIKGKRKKRALTEAFFTFGMQIIAYTILGVYLDDINAQPKMFSRDFYTKHLLNNPPLDFSLDLYALFLAKKHCEIIEIPVFFNKRQFGEAKGGGSLKTRIKLIKRTFKYIFELKNKIKVENSND